MRKIGLMSFIAVISMFTACTSSVDEQNQDDSVSDDEYYEFQDFILSDYEIPAVISLPDQTANIGASTRPEVVHVNSDIKWEINVGQNFQLLIEDYGDLTDLIKDKKADLASKKFFEVNYLIDKDDIIVYERKLSVAGREDAPSTVGFEHTTFHVYAQKVIDGITYEIRSPEGGCEKVIIELMEKSIRSLKSIKGSN